jgi:hypothetical protein
MVISAILQHLQAYLQVGNTPFDTQAQRPCCISQQDITCFLHACYNVSPVLTHNKEGTIADGSYLDALLAGCQLLLQCRCVTLSRLTAPPLGRQLLLQLTLAPG